MPGPFDNLMPQQGSTPNGVPVAPSSPTAKTPSPFDNLMPQNVAPQKPVAAPDGGSFMDHVTLFNDSFDRAALGGLQMIGRGVKKLTGYSGMDTAVQKGVDVQKAEVKQAWDNTSTEDGGHSWSGYGASALGMVGSGVAYSNLMAGMGIGVLGKAGDAMKAARPLLSRMGTSAAVGATMGMMDTADTEEQRLNKMAIGGVIGGAIPAVVSGAKALISPLDKVLSPVSTALDDKAYQIETQLNAADGGINPANVSKLMAANTAPKELGMKQLTPGQLLSGEGVSALRKDEINTLSKATDAQRRVMQFTEGANQTKLKGHITDVIKGMSSEETKQTADVLYGQLHTKSLANESVANLSANPLISNTLESLNSSGATLKGSQTTFASLPNNSVAKLDYAKQIIDDKLWNSKHSLDSANKLSKEVVSGMKNARNQIIDAIDAEHGSLYQPARAAAQKTAIQNNYLDMLNKVKGSSESGGLVDDVNKVHNALFGNSDKQAAFLKDIATTGGNTAQARNIMKVSAMLSNSTVEKVLNKGGQSMADIIASPSGIIQKALNSLTGRYDRAMIDLTMNPKWISEVSGVLTTPAVDRGGNLIKLLGKVSRSLDKPKTTGIVSGGMADAMTPTE